MKTLILCLLFATGCYYRFESQQANPGKADVIIVPGMQLTDDGRGVYILWNRMLAAKLRYDEGDAPRILVTGGKPRNGVTEAEKMLEYADQLGFPKKAMLAETKATSSRQNGRYAADLMVQEGLKSALVVSDWGHLRYAIPVFRDAFEARGLTLYWHSIDYDELRATGRSRGPDDPPE